eukprot:RCo008508
MSASRRPCPMFPRSLHPGAYVPGGMGFGASAVYPGAYGWPPISPTMAMAGMGWLAPPGAPSAPPAGAEDDDSSPSENAPRPSPRKRQRRTPTSTSSTSTAVPVMTKAEPSDGAEKCRGASKDPAGPANHTRDPCALEAASSSCRASKIPVDEPEPEPELGGVVVGPAPDLDGDNFARLSCLLDKTLAYSSFIQTHLPPAVAGGAGNAGVGVQDEGGGSNTSSSSAGDQPEACSVAEVAAKRKREGSGEKEKSGGEDPPSCGLRGGTLRRYQSVGVSWLVSLYKNGVNGILADEMGLGKTITTLAFLAHLWERKVYGPFLVVAPLSTLSNWQAELTKWCPFIPSMLYHGSKDERAQMQRSLVAQRRGAARSPTTGAGAAGRPTDPRCLITSYDVAIRDITFLRTIKWKYLIVDEAHRLKNFECRLIRELKRLHTGNRLLLTGTPLQNNLSELWSLLNFILPDIFDDLESFRSWFNFDEVVSAGQEDSNAVHRQIIHSEQQSQVITKLHGILRPFMLRRLKQDVGLDLPQKREVVLYCAATPKQWERYEAIRNKSLAQYLETSGPRGRAPPLRVLNTIMQLRKVCNHPFLFPQFDPFLPPSSDTPQCEAEGDDEVDEPLLTADTAQEEALGSPCGTTSVPGQRLSLHYDHYNPEHRRAYCEALVAECGKFALLHKMLPVLRDGGHKVLIFSQMTTLLDLLEDYMEISQFTYCRIDGSVYQKERQSRIELFNNDPKVFAFLLSTRAGGLGINLTAADTVIIYDSDWNPQTDLQAQDRCHRIGQTKPVCVYRLITANTVESYLLRRATRKLRLEHLVIEKGKFAHRENRQKLDLSDLEDALTRTGADASFGLNVPISDEQLRRLLDREYVMQLLQEPKQKCDVSVANPTAEPAGSSYMEAEGGLPSTVGSGLDPTLPLHPNGVGGSPSCSAGTSVGGVTGPVGPAAPAAPAPSTEGFEVIEELPTVF